MKTIITILPNNPKRSLMLLTLILGLASLGTWVFAAGARQVSGSRRTRGIYR